MPTDASTVQHWATLTGDKLAAKVEEKFREFEDALTNRELDRMQLATFAYYGCDEQGNDTAHIGRTGSQQQIRILKDNEYRTVIRNKLTIATSEPAGFQPVPANSDSDAQASVVLARGVLDYYFDELGAEKRCLSAAEVSENLGWAWVEAAWDEKAGPLLPPRPAMGPSSLDAGPTMTSGPPEPLPDTDATPPPMPGAETGTPPPAPGGTPNLTLARPRAGDVVVRHYLPTDVAFEFDARGETQWLCTRRWVNKFDLAAEAEADATEAEAQGDGERALALYAAAKKVSVMTGDIREDRVSRFVRGWTSSSQGQTGGPRTPTDEVAVLELRHKKTPGCPEGRWARVVSGVLLEEGPARYVDSLGNDDMAVYRIAAGERYGTPRAYTSAHDALGLQKAVDTLTSIVHSNQAGQGLNVIVSGEGTDLRPEDLREGLLALYAKGDPNSWPKRLDLAGTEPQIFEHRKTLKADLGSKLGMDDQAMGRGDLPSSGSLAALLDDKTQRSVSGLAKAYNENRREVATGILKRFQQFGQHSRDLPLTLGKTKMAVMRSFSGETLGGLDRVKLETVSTAMRGSAGRWEMGRLIVDAKTAGVPIQPLITLIETGKYESLVEDEFAAGLIIRQENERLLAGEALEPVLLDGTPSPPREDGQPVTMTASILDNPWEHIQGHKAVGGSPEARRNATIMGNANAHIAAHMRMLMAWVAGDPMLNAIHGPPVDRQGRPLTVAPPPMPGPGGPGAVSPDGSGGGPPSGPSGEARAPSKPKNPSTGEQWSPTGEVSNA